MRRSRSVLRTLITQPERFRFDAALRILMRRSRVRDPNQVARFRSEPGRAYPAAEVTAFAEATGSKPVLTVALMGLIGASGVLPRLYETLAVEGRRRGSAALHAFLDALAHRMVGSFARAGIKYRLHRSAEVAALAEPAETDQIGTALLALTGYATPGLVERLEAGPDPLLHYAGLFAMRPRSADRLAGLIADWIGRPVTVQQFAGHWLVLPPEQQTALPLAGGEGAWNCLGVDASIGDRSWDIQGRVVLRIGSLDMRDFRALLPDQPAFQRLVSLVRTYLGLEVGFAINPVLLGSAQVPLVLSDAAPPRLGWDAWVVSSESGPRQDAADAVFDAC